MPGAAAYAETAEESAESTNEDAAFDPFAGMDEDGRIPTVKRPADLANPDRWRYIPEGRIKPGNVLQRFLVSSFITPLFFTDSDVGTGGGIGIIDIDFRNQRRREFAGTFLSYTSEGQQNYSIVWRRWLHHRDLPGGGVLQEERSFVRAFAGYTKALTLRFFGIGPGTDERDETSYTDEVFRIGLGMERAWPEPGDNWVFTLGARGEFHNLSGGRVSNTPDTDVVFPGLFDDGDDQQIGYLEMGLRYDTRDSQRNPYGGWVVGARADAAVLQSQSDLGAVFGLFASRVFEVPGIFHSGGSSDEEHPPTDALAFGVRGWLTSGDLPFYALPQLGGGFTHRGFIEGRFRDRSAWLASVEHRFWVIQRGFTVPFTTAIRVERLGLATFYEAGAVARDAADWGRARVRHSYGVSFRLTLERQAPFRVDLGFSEDGFNLTARFGLSF